MWLCTDGGRAKRKRSLSYRFSALLPIYALTLFVLSLLPSIANDPFVYFAGNPANPRFRISGSCPNPSLTGIFSSFTSGDSQSTGNPARWTALGFRLHEPLTFDSIVYAPRGQTGTPNLRILITGATSDPHPVPDLNAIYYDRDFGAYPGDPPVSGQKDEQIPSYTGALASTRQIRTTPLGTVITLPPDSISPSLWEMRTLRRRDPWIRISRLRWGCPAVLSSTTRLVAWAAR